MAAYISFQPQDYFSPKLYTGTGSELAITSVGFQPDLIWIKERTGTESQTWTDAVRGATKWISSNNTDGEVTTAESVKSFDSGGFTLGTSGGINTSSDTYVSWNWKMGTTSGLTGGTITPSAYSISATAGQSVIAYTGTMALATVPHGLGKAPKLIICKQYDTGRHWNVYWGPLGATKYMELDGSAAAGTSSTRWNDTEPDATVFTVKNQDETNGAGTMLAYCFTDVKGYSKFGSYTGNGNVDGPFIYTGFRPAYIMIKSTSGAGAWAIFDNKRSEYNVVDKQLAANTTEVDQTSDVLDILSNGFKIRATSNMVNGSGWEYIYSAFAEFPVVSSNSKAGVAR